MSESHSQSRSFRRVDRHCFILMANQSRFSPGTRNRSPTASRPDKTAHFRGIHRLPMNLADSILIDMFEYTAPIVCLKKRHLRTPLACLIVRLRDRPRISTLPIPSY
ncbi:hypothetical protein RB9969 [Rhodopirellula baltica SH 1]|uniref:Uncharacterized protein n=1 Tax=Rhodopirellula baltica (strain DSM 10527 / NCIMB 13988 / SH1) TaxID=243090 RepID=Q7UKS8_RHOBA|nr:hypothetical protein RB9969 [Rhodopirellula baltica SH 1]